MVETLRNLGQVYFNFSSETQIKIISSLLIILVLWALRLLAYRVINRRFMQDTQALYSWRKAADYTAVTLGLLLVGRFWLDGMQSLATYLGLLSAGLAIALQDLIVNLAGWLFIYWRRPFKVGDRIEIGDHIGDVIDVRLFEFSLLEIGSRLAAEQSTGRILHVPNGRVFRDVLANYSQGLPYVWHEVPVMVTFESDWAKAKKILERLLNVHAPKIDKNMQKQSVEAGRRFVISHGILTPTVYTEVVNSGVLLTLRYLVHPRRVRDSAQTLWEAILHAFAPHPDIDFAYETTREFVHFREGKPVIMKDEG